MNKIKELVKLKLTPQKVKNGLTRKTQNLEIVDIANTSFKNDSLVSQNSDTHIILKLSLPAKYLKLIANISAKNDNAQTQVFYKSEDEEFGEENSIKFMTNHTSVQYIISNKPITHIRLDAINTDGEFDINYFEVIKITQSEYKLAQRLNTVKKIRAKIKQDPTLVKKFISIARKEGLKNALQKTKSSVHKEQHLGGINR
jgi:hypothetical protein